MEGRIEPLLSSPRPLVFGIDPAGASKDMISRPNRRECKQNVWNPLVASARNELDAPSSLQGFLFVADALRKKLSDCFLPTRTYKAGTRSNRIRDAAICAEAEIPLAVAKSL
jgi:hypothetical protein